MKKKTSIAIVIILMIAVIFTAIFLVRILRSEPVREKGNISEVDIEQYTKLSEHAYHGEVNFKEIYIAFKPVGFNDSLSKDLAADNDTSEYECAVFEAIERENGEKEYVHTSFYNVSIENGILSFEYVDGELEMYMEGTYSGDILTINGTPMEAISPDNLPQQVYMLGGIK